MTVSPVIKKVPGKLVRFDQEKDGFLDLAKLSHTELLDLNQREENLLKRKKFLDKLPDKGQKIKLFHERVQKELKKRDEHNKLCDLLAELNVNGSKKLIDELEWTGKCEPESCVIEAEDKDLVDPLRILATHSGTSVSKDKLVIKQEEVTFIKSSIIEKNSEVDVENIENFAKDLCHRFDSVKNREDKNKFYTHKSLNITSVKDLVKNNEPEIVRRSSSDVAVNQTKMLSLQESLAIQQQQTKRLNEIEVCHAMEKLMSKSNIKLDLPVNNISDYREAAKDSDEDVECESDILDSDDDEYKDTAVYYNLVD